MRSLQVLLILMLAMSCNKRAQDSSEAITSNDLGSGEELFEDFFKKFSTDSVYQNSRIKFPLLSIVEDDLGESEQSFIHQKDWGFFDLIKSLFKNS